MHVFAQDKSGINSLAGFSYQIRVYVYYMLTLQEGMQIEFETTDDVNIKEIKPDEIDNYQDNFGNKIIGKDSNTAIQVKRTNITEGVANKVLLNWILLESSSNKVNRYVLFTDDEYENKDIMFNKSAKEMFRIICESKKDSRATITKVKNLFKDRFDEFEEIILSIKDKYEFVSLMGLDQKIAERCTLHFRRAAVNSVVYYYRIKELLQHVTVQVMESINNKEPNIITFNDFMMAVEDITTRITEKVTKPLYADFKKLHTIDFNDLEVANSREYKQLLACKMPSFLVEQHLGVCSYYENLRYLYMESNKLGKIKDIEETTYENFETAKFQLQMNKRDIPYNRLEETKRLSNSYADSEQIRFGSGIYLTKDGIKDIQISWEDEENEKLET
ncbi:hypothetical protein [Virgibacillus salinus]|uniref:Uncharacterized protein n=1 Tax=Virgibacillus salinus TaxID=553311 RepID=A0A1H0ZHR1_9BACI|nr:hypothetical protein [Virgibacillus salinus]SDQ27008.1 hypothetical protein SAMN05216231_1245 [Virgibacillus salinus]